jgi:hypothetical protein
MGGPWGSPFFYAKRKICSGGEETVLIEKKPGWMPRLLLLLDYFKLFWREKVVFLKFGHNAEPALFHRHHFIDLALF